MTSEPGVNRAIWWPDGWPDMFVVVFAGQAHPYWLSVADVIIHPAERTVSTASRVAADTLRQWPGCALAAVGVPHRGCFVRTRWDRGQLCPGDGSERNTLESAQRAYMLLVRP
jgi:hypothetical protein